jgi:hypothetical protein
MKAIAPTPWNYYRDNHEARMREYRAFESFRSKDSLQHKPAFQTRINWPVLLGWGGGAVLGIAFWYVIARRLGVLWF